MQIVKGHARCSFTEQILRKQRPRWKIRYRRNDKTKCALWYFEEKVLKLTPCKYILQFVRLISGLNELFIYKTVTPHLLHAGGKNLQGWTYHFIWILFISLRTWLTRLYTTTLSCIYVILCIEQANEENVFIPHTSLSHQLTKELQQDCSLFPTESRGLCEATPLFIEKHFSHARLLNAVCVLRLQGARRIREEVKAERRSEELEEPQGALRTSAVGIFQNSSSFSSSAHIRLDFSQVTDFTL